MLKQTVRILGGALLVLVVSSRPAGAAPITIGFVSWQLDAGGVDFTLGLDVFGDWPGDLALSDAYVDFTRADGSSDQAFFGGYVGGVGQTVTLDATSGSLQVPGFGPAFDPLPQDIVSAVLRFTYDTTLGSVLVGALGPQFDALGAPTFDLREIVFDRAETPAPVPEPATLVLFGTMFSAWGGYRAVRRRRA